MTSFSRKIAAVGILWAIFAPCVLFVRELYDSRSVELHVMVQNLHSVLPKEPAGDKDIVSLPAQAISNWAGVLHNIAAREDADTKMLCAVIMISSVAIVILSICILKTKTNEKITS